MIYPLDIEFESNGMRQTITPVLLKDGNQTILVDCGYPNFIGLIREAAERWGISLEMLTQIIVTHDDIDHIGSLAALKRTYPHVNIISHAIEAPYISGFEKSLRLVQAEDMQAKLPENEKARGEQFIRFLQTVEHVPVDQRCVTGKCCLGAAVSRSCTRRDIRRDISRCISPAAKRSSQGMPL